MDFSSPTNRHPRFSGDPDFEKGLFPIPPPPAKAFGSKWWLQDEKVVPDNFVSMEHKNFAA